MRSVLRHIIFSCCLLYTATTVAQDSDPEMDSLTTILEAPASADSDTTFFNTAIVPAAIQERRVPQAKIDSLKAADDFWYANTVPERKKKPVEQKETESIFRLQWVRSLLWMIVLVSFIAVVIWYLQSSNIFLFRKRSRKISDEEQASEEEDNIFTLPYDREIAAAEAAQNFRLAVRLRYLQALKELADRQLIDYRFGRTNSDYVLQLVKSRYHRDFFRLTRNFEYTWYGQFDLSAEAYEMMRRDFYTFQTSLR